MRPRSLLVLAVVFSENLNCMPFPDSTEPSDEAEPKMGDLAPVYVLPDAFIMGCDCSEREGSLCESKSQVDHIVTLRVETVEPSIYPAWLALCQREPWVFVEEEECSGQVRVGLRVSGKIENVIHGGFLAGDQITVSIGADVFDSWDRAPFAETTTTYAWLGMKDTPPRQSGVFPGMLIGIPLVETQEGEKTLLNPFGVWFTLDDDNRVVPQWELSALEKSCLRSVFARHAAGLSLDEIEAVEACPLENPRHKGQASRFPSGRWSGACSDGSAYIELYGMPDVCLQEESDNPYEEP
jgi:hypothetical protein